MHFVSAQSKEETLADITSFISDNLRESVKNPDAASLKDFENKIAAFQSKKDYVGILEQLLTVKQELVTLPSSHKSSQLTIQRMVLLILPLFKKVEESKDKHAALRKLVQGFSDMVEESDFPQSIKVNAYFIVTSLTTPL